MKKIMLLILITLLCITSFALVSCNGEDDTTTTIGDATTTENSDNTSTLPPIKPVVKCKHVEEIVVGKAPTTTSTGLTDGKKCTLCGETLIFQSIIPATSVIDGFEYKLNDDNASYSVIGIGNITDNRVVIPSAYNNFPVTRIEYEAFKNCATITEVVIPNSITYIGKSAFESCANLTSINLPDGITKMGLSVFKGCSKLTEIDLPNSITRIESYTFSGCYDLVSVEIPEGVTFIGVCAFKNCESLISVEIPDSVTQILLNSFENCKSLKSAKLSRNITVMSKHLFSGCESLESIEIPESVTEMEVCVFEGCKSLTELRIPATLTNIHCSYSTFAGCNIKEYIVASDNPNYKSIDGILFNKSGDTLLRYPSAKADKIYTVSDDVVCIYNGAFGDCDNLEEVILPVTVTKIGERAFSCCDNLKRMKILLEVKEISYRAFSECPSLYVKCEAVLKPTNWNSFWVDKSTPVTWACLVHGWGND